ncbi:exodeoxyribonuclease VII large subunit [Candidatus Doolittlea endobia]|uniref:Exodeoxyribonuclease 7 large subunit n=1 Tax=Candidatus Doolittlea endobia TaxID=1778262 RepID=A0A143WRS3_9ENTR|nr:exodeoxyribonuclease VII large subunit [Candidatus Doolittlea endobia]CUX96432.1 Exodeoxyribonuclease 7 large subunit [Candidatus Doolittlea endobia]
MSTQLSSLVFTVSRLNETVRELLEGEIGRIWLTGEISNFSQPASGHWYFTLKDNRTQVRCATFRNVNRRIIFSPRNGQQVLVRASLTLYEPRGDYQLIAENMQPAGDGFLQQEFEQLKQQLSDEGLFSQQFKQPLISPVCRVGVITSASGAALHDILQVLQRRDPSLSVVIYPTVVQGQEAPAKIVRAIETANRRAECDVLIVGRGGGSLEDLASFNDERVARAIFASLLPVVSAVGHETDVTIADFVADLRAPTPSAAAELVSRDQLELLRQFQSQEQRLEMAMDYLLAQHQQRYNCLQYRLQQQHPQLRLARQNTALVTLHRRLDDGVQGQWRHAQRCCDYANKRLVQQALTARINQAQQRLQALQYQLIQGINTEVNRQNNAFIALCSRLEGMSPLQTLARGFSITTDAYGAIVKNTRQLNIGDHLTIRLNDGWIESKVTKITC